MSRCDDAALSSGFIRHGRRAYGQVDFAQSRGEGCSIGSVVCGVAIGNDQRIDTACSHVLGQLCQRS